MKLMPGVASNARKSTSGSAPSWCFIMQTNVKKNQISFDFDQSISWDIGVSFEKKALASLEYTLKFHSGTTAEKNRFSAAALTSHRVTYRTHANRKSVNAALIRVSFNLKMKTPAAYATSFLANAHK
jgi:hypothetical protein